jgi:hypothetical protein
VGRGRKREGEGVIRGLKIVAPSTVVIMLNFMQSCPTTSVLVTTNPFHL